MLYFQYGAENIASCGLRGNVEYKIIVATEGGGGKEVMTGSVQSSDNRKKKSRDCTSPLRIENGKFKHGY